MKFSGLSFSLFLFSLSLSLSLSLCLSVSLSLSLSLSLSVCLSVSLSLSPPCVCALSECVYVCVREREGECMLQKELSHSCHTHVVSAGFIMSGVYKCSVNQSHFSVQLSLGPLHKFEDGQHAQTECLLDLLQH